MSKKITGYLSLIVVVIISTVVISNSEKVCADNYVINNPRVENGVSTWDYVYFGSYPQSSDGKGGYKTEPIKWRILSVDGNDAFVLADRVLDCKKYNEYENNVTWEKSALRSWLNGYGSSANINGEDYTEINFVNTAFSSKEKSAIITTKIINDNNPFYGSEGGNNTSDLLFLLSIDEVKTPKYGFVTDYKEASKERECKATEYAINQGCVIAKNQVYYGNCRWWLRSPGYSNNGASQIWEDGSGYDDSIHIERGVRPALHLNLSSNVWSKAGTVSSDETGEEITKNQNTTTTSSVATGKTSTPGLLKPSIKKIKAKKKTLKITWIKVKDVNGYKLQYSLEKNFEKEKTITIKKASITSKTIKKLKSKKKYYIRIRTYKIISGKAYQSVWSKVKSKKTK